MATVTLDQLTKRYAADHSPAVDSVSLAIEHGEFMVLLGPSGCGKTTTLRMIAGLESISSGTLSINALPMNAVAARDRDIAMVFQSYALYPHMTVADNLAFGLRRRGLGRAEVDRRVTAVAETLELSPYLSRKPHALSGGQRQRVALGRAIVRDPQVFLFDEPLSNLDAALRVSTRGELTRLHRRLGATMIYVTHDQVEAMTMGTRICIMNGGKVAQVGTPLEVYRRPANTFVAGFLGNPPMNLIAAQMTSIAGGPAVRIGASELPLAKGRISRQPTHADVSFGLRPEHISDRPASPEAALLKAEVHGVERLGAETMLNLRFDGVASEVIARLPGQSDATIGSLLDVYLDLSQAHLFDRDGATLLS